MKILGNDVKQQCAACGSQVVNLTLSPTLPVPGGDGRVAPASTSSRTATKLAN